MSPINTDGAAVSVNAEDRAKAGAFFVPTSTADWDRLAARVDAFVEAEGLVPPLTYDELAAAAQRLLAGDGLTPKHREFLMVMINNAIWRDVVAAIPFARRTLLLPPCLRSSTACPAEADEYGLLCEQCGACCIGALSQRAEELGYAVLVAEGTSLVGRLIAQGQIDAVIGVSCMPSLERTFPHMSARAIPGIAVPLLVEGCEDTQVYVDWVRAAIERYADNGVRFVDLKAVHAEVQSWFEPGALRELLGVGDSETERIAIDWLEQSGKRWRPFLVVAVYMAMCDAELGRLPLPIRRLAVAVECIHKASLIYDDIQDDDACRYGAETVHETHGIPVALTSGLFLLGLGYRLIADCGADPARCAAMIALATRGHCDLCLGQGAELCWMRKPTPLSAEAVLEIFRFKTAPSFDVVFRLGAICAGVDDETQAILRGYSQAVGVAYQIQDDLDDFTRDGDVDDVRSRRPSIVIALAHERSAGEDRALVEEAWCRGGDALLPDRVRAIIGTTGADEAARGLLDRYKGMALAAVAGLKNRDLKILLHRIVGMLFKQR